MMFNLPALIRLVFKEWRRPIELTIMQYPGDAGVFLRTLYLQRRLASMGDDCLLLERVRLIRRGKLSLGDRVGISPDVQTHAAAGAVVAHDVAPLEIVGGVPAKMIGRRGLGGGASSAKGMRAVQSYP